MSRVFSKAICVAVLSSLVVHAQDKSVIATSTNLSEALSAKQWTNVESSVDQGLQWLASQQKEDGRFPSEDLGQPAVTSFAVMAFLSRGYLPDQGPYGKTVSKAIDFVLSTQHRQGYFSLLPVAAPAEHGTPAQVVTYNHAIAGLMLGEVYGMCSGDRSKRIEQALHRALTYHRKVQARVKSETNLKGGWRYGFPESPNASSDLSVTGWALMFYRSARNAEFDIPKQYYEEGLDFVERCYGGNGMFRYQPETGQFSLANTASGTLTLILGGRQDSPSVLATTNYFRSRRYPKPWEERYFYLTTYYSSQAMAQIGGEAWEEVFPQIAASLLSEQEPSGAWPPGGVNEKTYGSAYSTSLAVLALTPAYALLPIYQR